MNGSTVKDITEDIAKNVTEDITDEPGAATPATPEQRCALLTARAGLEPELAQRYSQHPLSVLAEFGLPATRPDTISGPDTIARPDTIAPEDLDRAGSSVTWGCFSNFTHLSAPGR